MHLFAFFYMTTFSYVSTVEDAFFSPFYSFSFFVKKLSVYKCVDLCLGLLFDSIDPSVFFNANTMLFLKNHYCFLVEIEIRVDDTSLAVVEDSFSNHVFFPYKVEDCSFKICKKLCWNFDGNCIEFVDCFW